MPPGTQDTGLLKPYLPRLVLRWLSKDSAGMHRALNGSIAFVDISGFTKLSERLARRGKVGAEELADAIDTCFGRLLAAAYSAGGSLLKFGGDALLLFFEGDDHAAKATRAAYGMRRELRDIGTLKLHEASVKLRMSCGVHSGMFDFFLVGDSHRELIVTGPAATKTVEMEGTAEAGEIVVSPDTAARLPAGCVGEPKGDGFLLRKAPTTLEPARIEYEHDAADSALAGCVPSAVREHLLAGVHEAEHRPVVIAFIHFDGTDDVIRTKGAEAAAHALHALVRDVQNAAGRHAVGFLSTDIDRDGGKIILTGGAPVVSGDDEERMLLTLREVVESERTLPVRIGVNRGHVFAGDIGPSFRRTYTVMGDDVNLAARVMARATPGAILATEAVLSRSKTPFATTPLEPFMVKGKAKPIRAWEVGPRSGARGAGAHRRLPLVGRAMEMGLLHDALRASQSGQGSLVEIVGETGIGKSRLIEELIAGAEDTAVIAAACEPLETATPYAAFRTLARSMLGIDDRAPGAAAESRLREVLSALTPQLMPWAPLFGPLIDAEIPETLETKQLEERFRRSRLAEVFIELLDRLLPFPSLFVFDDAHWMDDASAGLLGRLELAVQHRPWMACVTRRDTASGFAARSGGASLRLLPLEPDAAEAFLTEATAGTPLRPDEASRVLERSGGNPLFLRELLAAAKDGPTTTLPDSIESLVMSRIDGLPPSDRVLLRHASVLGRSFPKGLLPAVVDDLPPDQDEIWERLYAFITLDEAMVRFTHALIRDVAYEGLSYRLRRELHGRAGASIEQSATETGTPDLEADILSFHFGHAQIHAKAWHYSLVAAERARAIYANVEAAGFYERALEAAGRSACASDQDLVRVHESLGDVRAAFGSYESASAAYRSVRKLVRGNAVTEARLLLKVGLVKGWMAKYPEALSWIRRGLNTLKEERGDAADRQRSQLLAWYAYHLLQEGRQQQAITWAMRAVEEAERADDLEAMAQACKVLDWSAMDLGTLEEPVNALRALELYEKLGDLSGQASILNMLGAVAYWHGDWTDALSFYERARDIVKRTGNAVMHAFCVNNIGEILADQGHTDEAEKLFREAARVWESAGHRSGFAYVRSNLARVAVRSGRFDDALALYEEARTEAETLNAESDILEMDARLAEFWLLRGDPQRALAMADESLIRAAAHGGVIAQLPTLQRVRGYALAALGEHDIARAAFEAALETARARKSDYDVALTLDPLARLDADAGRDIALLQAESRSILDRLGVVKLPDLFADVATTKGADR